MFLIRINVTSFFKIRYKLSLSLELQIETEKTRDPIFAPAIDDFFDNYGYRIVLALRRITHEVDAYSRKLVNEHNITGPQLLCLYFIANHSPATLSQISRQLSLSASTVNGIVDRLTVKLLVARHRPEEDRRKVMLTLTAKGRDVVANAPKLLHRSLAEKIRQLPDIKQAAIALSLEEIVTLMDSGDLNGQ